MDSEMKGGRDRATGWISDHWGEGGMMKGIRRKRRGRDFTFCSRIRTATNTFLQTHNSTLHSGWDTLGIPTTRETMQEDWQVWVYSGQLSKTLSANKRNKQTTRSVIELNGRKKLSMLKTLVLSMRTHAPTTALP